MKNLQAWYFIEPLLTPGLTAFGIFHIILKKKINVNSTKNDSNRLCHIKSYNLCQADLNYILVSKAYMSAAKNKVIICMDKEWTHTHLTQDCILDSSNWIKNIAHSSEEGCKSDTLNSKFLIWVVTQAWEAHWAS